MEPLKTGVPTPHQPDPHNSPAQHEEHVAAHVQTHGNQVIITIDIADHHRHSRPHPRPDPGVEIEYILTIDGDKFKTLKSHPTGQEILALAGKTPEHHHLSQQHGEHGQMQVSIVKPTEKVNLQERGIELFLTKPVETTIYVNGTPQSVTKKKLSFGEIVALAHLASGPNMSYTLTYRKGPASKPEGSMVEGDNVHVKEGMIFNVTATDKS